MSVAVHHGDCLEVLRGLDADSVDSCVTDPPYGLGFMGKAWDTPGAFVERKPDRSVRFDKVGGNHNPCNPQDAARSRRVEGAKFGRWCEAWAAEVLRVLKPGAHLVAFGGTRTYHRMACAIEDAGFEIRDQLAWVYGSGFPKSRDISRDMDRMVGAEREVVGDGPYAGKRPNPAPVGGVGGLYRWGDEHMPWDELPEKARAYFRAAAPASVAITAPATDAARQWQGFGTALKPAFEPIVLARKPLAEPTVAANVLRHGTGALNVDACRVAHAGADDLAESLSKNPGRGDLVSSGVYGANRPQQSVNAAGRWPANLCHDGSDEVLEAFAAFGPVGANGGKGQFQQHAWMLGPGEQDIERSKGSAARFFYCAKASAAERAGSKHPTVKPLALMRWLVRLVTPPGGLVLDSFAGTGVTGEAALLEGCRAVLIEREAEYHADCLRRIEAARRQGDMLAEVAA